MKQYLPKSLILGSALGWMLCAALPAMAGNKDRIGQAGANELLINPWSRSTGWGSANTASVTGLESVNLNVAGLAFTNKTEVIFSNTSWLRGSDININAFGLAQRLSESSVLGLAVMSMNFGDIDVTTTNLPEGGLGTFSPQYLNVGVSYAREFSNSIYGGITMKAISESTADVGAQGIAFDMGIRYVTGEKDQIKFGIGLRNVGPKMSFSGDGLATSVNINNNEFTLVQRTDGFELPAVLNIGFSYDYYLVERIDSTGKGAKADHRITGAGNFTSNSFGKDQIHVGVEYGYKNFFMLRAGFVYEEDIFKTQDEGRTTAYTGPSAGATVMLPFGKSGFSNIGLDYSYQATSPFDGTHSIGLRVTL